MSFSRNLREGQKTRQKFFATNLCSAEISLLKISLFMAAFSA